MFHKLSLSLASAIAAITLFAGSAQSAAIINGGFETGTFAGWIPTDITTPFDPLVVAPAGTPTAFSGFLGPNVVIPSAGAFAATNGFDGDGMPAPGFISLAQDIGLIAAGEKLMFDYRLGWDLIAFSVPSNSPRLFDVLIEPFGGGAPIMAFPILTALIGTDTFGGPNSDTGPLSAMIDLTPFAGISARVNFLWTIPDAFSGPANAQLDNVKIVSAVPEPGTLALFGLGLAGLGFARRRKAA